MRFFNRLKLRTDKYEARFEHFDLFSYCQLLNQRLCMKTLLTGKKILVVDDEDLLREILVEDLSSAGATVLDAANGTIAFDLLQKENFDAVVTDIRMPGGNGIKLIKNIKSHFEKNAPKVFVCSGYNDMTLDETQALSVAYTFNKPFDRESFIKTIAEYLNQLG